MKRSGYFSIGNSIARALMLTALIVMACGPALAATQSLKLAGTIAPVLDTQTAGGIRQALAEAEQKPAGKTTSSRCKSRSCLQPALQLATLPDAKAPTEQVPVPERDGRAASGVIVRVTPPPPKSAVS